MIFVDCELLNTAEPEGSNSRYTQIYILIENQVGAYIKQLFLLHQVKDKLLET